MLYLAIPAHNEAATIGVLLWRLRTVLAEFPREYEAVVYDDASSDSTSEILESYARVMPLTVLRGERQVGYAGAVDALIRHVVRDTRYPRRDAMLLLQGDFTDSPALVPEFVKRFEGGTDVVVGERGSAVRRKAPTPVKRLLRAEPWLLRFLVRADGLRDLTSSYRLVRISVLRDLLRAVGDLPTCEGDARTANADLLMRLVPLARRVEALPVEPTWDVRLRQTRVDAFADGMHLLRWAWKSRGQRAVPSSAPEPPAEHAPRHTKGGRGDRDGRPELRLESRSDTGGESAVGSEHSRPAAGRENGRGGRKARPPRSESRTDARSETRTADGRNAEGRSAEGRSAEGRNAEGRNAEGRNAEGRSTDGRSADASALDGRRETRTPAPRQRKKEREGLSLDSPASAASFAPDGVADAAADASENTSTERPARRKRSRRGGRDRDAGAPGGDESTETAQAADTRRAPESALTSGVESAPPIPDGFEVGPPEESLSAGLRDAVSDVESELDGENRQRPRKKRRRRGGRNAKRLAGDETAAEGEFGDGAAPSADSADFESGPTGPDSMLESFDGSAEGGSDTDSGGDATTDGAEARGRRRGRRGRRGGSRRSRGTGSESGEVASDNGDATTGSASFDGPAERNSAGAGEASDSVTRAPRLPDED